MDKITKKEFIETWGPQIISPQKVMNTIKNRIEYPDFEQDLKSLIDSAVEKRGKCKSCGKLLPVECDMCKRLWES